MLPLQIDNKTIYNHLTGCINMSESNSPQEDN